MHHGITFYQRLFYASENVIRYRQFVIGDFGLSLFNFVQHRRKSKQIWSGILRTEIASNPRSERLSQKTRSEAFYQEKLLMGLPGFVLPKF